MIFPARTPHWFHMSMLMFTCLFATGNSLADFSQLEDDGWHTWRVEAIEDAPDWCCYTWNRGRVTGDGCELDGRNSGYGSSDDRRMQNSQMQIYALLKDGEISRIRALSPQCPVTTDSPVLDLGIVDADLSVRWLKDKIEPASRESSHALGAIAVHDGALSLTTLIEVAENSDDLENRKDAVFWMGQVRATEAESDITRLMFNDDNADFREHAAFSLSQSDAPGRVDALVRLGKEDGDTEVRAQAWFWLAQTGVDDVENEISRAIREEDSDDVREDAIFALSQLPEERAVRALMTIIEDRGIDADSRKEALFWLAQLDSEPAMDFIEALLSES